METGLVAPYLVQRPIVVICVIATRRALLTRPGHAGNFGSAPFLALGDKLASGLTQPASQPLSRCHLSATRCTACFSSPASQRRSTRCSKRFVHVRRIDQAGAETRLPTVLLLEVPSREHGRAGPAEAPAPHSVPQVPVRRRRAAALSARALTSAPPHRNMHDFVSQHRDAIHCISCEVHHRAGGCIGSEEPQTALGKQAWAKARKPSGLALLRREWGRLDNVDMTGEDGCDGHLQGLGAVRRSGRVATEAVDAVR